MTLDRVYWESLAADYIAAYAGLWPPAGGIASEPSHRNALIIAMSIAEHETNNGRAWPDTNNFGAVQLRGLTSQERALYDYGSLKAGDYTPERDGVLHVDTHPGPRGPQKYPVWFAAFDKRVDGITHFIRTLWRLSGAAPDAEDATCATVALAMYQHGYYEGAHPGARLVGKRSLPLIVAEQLNVDDYARATEACRGSIEAMLSGWDYGREQNVEPADPVAGA
jgi:hypothetical protein